MVLLFSSWTSFFRRGTTPLDVFSRMLGIHLPPGGSSTFGAKQVVSRWTTRHRHWRWRWGAMPSRMDASMGEIFGCFFFGGGESINKFAFPNRGFFWLVGILLGVGWVILFLGGWHLVFGVETCARGWLPEVLTSAGPQKGKNSSSKPFVFRSFSVGFREFNFTSQLQTEFLLVVYTHPRNFRRKRHNAWKMSFLLKGPSSGVNSLVKLRGCKLFGNLHPHKSISPSLGGLNIARSYLSLGYIEDYTTQLCGDYNKAWNKDPYLTTSMSWKISGRVFFSHLAKRKWLPTKASIPKY